METFKPPSKILSIQRPSARDRGSFGLVGGVRQIEYRIGVKSVAVWLRSALIEWIEKRPSAVCLKLVDPLEDFFDPLDEGDRTVLWYLVGFLKPIEN